MTQIHESEVQENVNPNITQEVSREERIHRRKKLSKGAKWAIGVTCAIGTFVLGGVVGYGVIGKGNPVDALKISTWKHIYDLVYKDVE